MLTDEQTEDIRQRLTEAENRLYQNARQSLQASRERANETGRDSLDQSTSEEMLSTDLRLRDREKKLLSKIRGALQRLEAGTIDQCEDCGEPIGYKRLVARPVTTLCIECKESREEQERREAAEAPPEREEIPEED